MTRKYSGKQYDEEMGNHKRLAITISLFSQYEEIPLKKVNNIIVHEFGHIFCLGHSENENDIMCPSWKSNVASLSNNDKLVLNLIYTLGEGKNFISCQKQIENFIQKYNNNFCTDKNILSNNLLENLIEISDINKNKLQLQNIKVDTVKRKI